jgi:Uma2 family endonuclease
MIMRFIRPMQCRPDHDCPAPAERPPLPTAAPYAEVSTATHVASGLREAHLSADMTVPAWMHERVTAEQYGSWSEEQCAGIEVVDAMVVVSPSASKRHNRLPRVPANALDTAAGTEWNADLDLDVRPQDVPLTNRRPDVVVYRADTIDMSPTRPEHIALVVEVVSPGSETTDRVVKVDQYARAGIPFYWRIEQAATGVPLTHTYVLDYVLDAASGRYRDGAVFTGVVKATAPFAVEIDLGSVRAPTPASFPWKRSRPACRTRGFTIDAQVGAGRNPAGDGRRCAGCVT